MVESSVDARTVVFQIGELLGSEVLVAEFFHDLDH